MRLAKLGRHSKPEIQMSSLIDVVFLLLLFYAVTTQFVSNQRLKLKLPEAKTSQAVGRNEAQKMPVVTVAKDGSIWIDGRRVSDADLERTLKTALANRPKKAIVLKGDRGADYGIVVHVLDVARSIGATSIQMSTVKPQKAPE